MAWLAIDAGTSVIKAVAYSGRGEELAVTRARTDVLHPQLGWSEQDMTAVWAAVVETARRCAAESPEPLTGIVCTGQGDGCWLVDESGAPTGNAILWNDARAATQIADWQRAGVLDRGFRLSGSVSYPGLLNAILAWLERFEPERLERARWALTCNGWVFSRLTGRFAAEISDGSNPFSDVRSGEYSSDVAAIYGLSRHARLLPPTQQGGSIAEGLTAEAAEALDLRAGLPVIMAPYDIVSTAYGAGACCPGEACVILGTTICAEEFTREPNLTAKPAGTTLALGSGVYLRAMPTLTGCEALEWAARMFGLDSIEALAGLAAKGEEQAGGVFFLPYLSPAGERSPFIAPGARGSVHGMSFGTGQAEMAWALFEGLSFTVRECLEACAAAKPSVVRVCGGGARSDWWCQMLADVLETPVTRARGSEMGSRGAYLYAMAVTRGYSIGETVSDHLAIERTFNPGSAPGASYARRYAGFVRLREAAQTQWDVLAGLK